MRTLYILALCCFTLSCFGQETYYKRYGIKNFIDFLEDRTESYDYDSLTSFDKKIKLFFYQKKYVYHILN